MDALARARRNMVNGQLRTSGVTDLRLIAAMQDIPRERFVPPDKVALAYLDCDLPVGSGRHLLKPVVLARLIESADVRLSDRALDVGCATGYSTAVLARLAAEVVAVEEDDSLTEAARSTLSALKVSNARVRQGSLKGGAPEEAPFDVILINGAVDFVPDSLSTQLTEGGRLVCVMRDGPVGRGMLFRASGGHVSGRSVFDVVSPLLPGFQREPAFVF